MCEYMCVSEYKCFMCSSEFVSFLVSGTMFMCQWIYEHIPLSVIICTCKGMCDCVYINVFAVWVTFWLSICVSECVIMLMWMNEVWVCLCESMCERVCICEQEYFTEQIYELIHVKCYCDDIWVLKLMVLCVQVYASICDHVHIY